MVRKILGFSSDVFWMIVSVFFAFAVGLFLLHILQAHLPGVLGNVAGGVESAITPGR